MAIMGRHADPWGEDETAFEQLSTSAAAVQIKKTAADAVTTVAGDIKNQFTTTVAVESAGDEVNKPEADRMLVQTRQNLKRIDAEIKQAREEREKKYQERLKSEKREQQKKIELVQKKNKQEDSLQAAIKRSQGSGERAKVAG